jgi:hypothetical protein
MLKALAFISKDQFWEVSSVNNLPSLATAARWSARILSTLIFLFWTFFLAASFIGDAARSSHPLALADYLILSTLITALVGLALAWKWELTGAAITLLAVLACAAVNWKVLVFPGTLIPMAAVLYLLSWWWRRSRRNPQQV